MTLLLAITVTLTITPTEADMVYMGALVQGEAGGMGHDAMQLVADNVVYDWLAHGTRWLRTRWYAPLKPSREATELVRQSFRGFTYPQCDLVGNKFDVLHWLEHGYLPPGAVADYSWLILDGRFQLHAFGCRWRAVKMRQVWTCEGDLCPQ